VSETPSTPAGTDDEEASGRTPSAPDVDQPDGGSGGSGKTPSAPDVDQPDGGAHG
jgi:hypothetical protein